MKQILQEWSNVQYLHRFKFQELLFIFCRISWLINCYCNFDSLMFLICSVGLSCTGKLFLDVQSFKKQNWIYTVNQQFTVTSYICCSWNLVRNKIIWNDKIKDFKSTKCWGSNSEFQRPQVTSGLLTYQTRLHIHISICQ